MDLRKLAQATLNARCTITSPPRLCRPRFRRRLMSSRSPAPSNVVLHTASRVLEVEFDDGASFRLPFEFLRVYSPSADVRGHGPGQETLQVGKRDVMINALQPVGHYAIQPSFSDGHDSGIYSWEYLYELGQNQERMWAEYLQRLEAAGASREGGGAPAPVAPGCSRH